MCPNGNTSKLLRYFTRYMIMLLLYIVGLCNLHWTWTREINFEEAAVLHYNYTRLSNLSSRRDWCGCKPTEEDTKRCFMPEFDRDVSLCNN